MPITRHLASFLTLITSYFYLVIIGGWWALTEKDKNVCADIHFPEWVKKGVNDEFSNLFIRLSQSFFFGKTTLHLIFLDG